MDNIVAKDLENRIVCHISRGNDKAISIIRKFHMDEVEQIRDYMLIFVKDGLNNPWLLNQYFHMAVNELNINLVDLITPGTKIISDKKQLSKVAF